MAEVRRAHQVSATCWCEPTLHPVERTCAADAVPIYVHHDPAMPEDTQAFHDALHAAEARVRETGVPGSLIPPPPRDPA